MHALFYTICQSILYAACYKREELINIGLELSTAVSAGIHPLNSSVSGVSFGSLYLLAPAVHS